MINNDALHLENLLAGRENSKNLLKELLSFGLCFQTLTYRSNEDTKCTTCKIIPYFASTHISSKEIIPCCLSGSWCSQEKTSAKGRNLALNVKGDVFDTSSHLHVSFIPSGPYLWAQSHLLPPKPDSSLNLLCLDSNQQATGASIFALISKRFRVAVMLMSTSAFLMKAVSKATEITQSPLLCCSGHCLGPSLTWAFSRMF